MLVYRTRLHRRLMEESEKGLFAAIASRHGRWGHVAEEVAYDCRKFSAWEASHARLLEPVAAAGRWGPTIGVLRRAEMDLVHRRALFETLREKRVRGQARERLFQLFYGPRDFRNCVLTEHFRYQLAATSSVTAVRLSTVCKDPAGSHLLGRYESAYRRYFWAYCEWQLNEDPLVSDVLRLTMESTKFLADRLKQQLVAGRDLQIGRERPMYLES